MTEGIIKTQTPDGERVDHLFRVSLKAYVENDEGEVLVVKEAGREWWDLPGGGMDHGDTFQSALARELEEEIGYRGDFTYEILDVDDPHPLRGIDVLQTRLVFRVTLRQYEPISGADADEVAYMNPKNFENSIDPAEQKIMDYWRKARK